MGLEIGAQQHPDSCLGRDVNHAAPDALSVLIPLGRVDEGTAMWE